MIEEVISAHGSYIKYVPRDKITEELIIKALDNDEYALVYLNNETEEVVFDIISKYPMAVTNLDNQSHRCKMMAVNNGVSIHDITSPTNEMVELACDIHFKNRQELD